MVSSCGWDELSHRAALLRHCYVWQDSGAHCGVARQGLYLSLSPQPDNGAIIMSLSMYEVSIPVLARMLGNLAAILRKAEANAQARGIEPKVFIESRLAPDMYPLARQVQIASDMAKGCATRLAGVEVPSWADTETSFEELQARIAKTQDFI